MNNNWVTILWIGIGFSGQILFGLRLLIQWLASEKQKKSVIPVMFWYFSISGSVMLLAYAVYRQDPVFIVGQLFGLFVYIRNLYLIRAEKKLAFNQNNHNEPLSST